MPKFHPVQTTPTSGRRVHLVPWLWIGVVMSVGMLGIGLSGPVAAQIVPNPGSHSIALPVVLRNSRFIPRPTDPPATATRPRPTASPTTSGTTPTLTPTTTGNTPTVTPTPLPNHTPGVPACERTVGDAGGVRISKDGGATLLPGAGSLAPVAYTWDIEIDPREPDVVLELHQGVLYRSTDAGCTFRKYADLPGTLWDQVTRAPSAPNILVLTSIFDAKLRYSSDDGVTWQEQALPDDVVRFAIDPKDPWRWSFAGRNRALYVRENLEGKWEARPIPYPGDEQTVSAAQAWTGDGGSVWLAGSQFDGLWRSMDEGKTWDAVNEGLFGSVGSPAEPVTAVVVVAVTLAPSNPNIAYASVNRVGRNAAERGIWRSEDVAKGWVQSVRENDQVGDRTVTLTGGTQVFVSPLDQDHAFFAFGMNFQNYGTDLFRSTDGLKTLAVSHFDDLYDVKAMGFGAPLDPPEGLRQLRPVVYVGGSSARPNLAAGRHPEKD